jgi:hypothetical protein
MATTHQQCTFFTNNRILAHLNIGYENEITGIGTTKFLGLQTCNNFNLNIHNEYARAFYKWIHTSLYTGTISHDGRLGQYKFASSGGSCIFCLTFIVINDHILYSKLYWKMA